MAHEWMLLALASALLAAPVPAHASAGRTEVQIVSGMSSIDHSGQIKGYAVRDYDVRATGGQRMTITLQSNNRSTFFNVTREGVPEALFIGSTGGRHFSARLPESGAYRVRVYLMRDAARRNEVADYRLMLEVGGQAGRTTFPENK